MKVRELIAQLEQAGAPEAEVVVLVQWRHGAASDYARVDVGRVADAGADGWEPTGRAVVLHGASPIKILRPVK